MSFTYFNNPNIRQLDAVRLELGDTYDDSHLVEDEEIDYALTQENNLTLKAAARLAANLAARFAREEVLRVGQQEIDRGALQEHFRQLAKDLRSRIVTSNQVRLNTMRRSQHQKRFLDTNLVQPSFRRGMHNSDRVDTTTIRQTTKTEC